MGKLLLAQAPPSYPRTKRSSFPGNFPWAQIPERAGLSGVERPGPVPSGGGGGSHFISSAIKTYQRRIIKSRDIFQICMLNELTLPA